MIAAHINGDHKSGIAQRGRYASVQIVAAHNKALQTRVCRNGIIQSPTEVVVIYRRQSVSSHKQCSYIAAAVGQQRERPLIIYSCAICWLDCSSSYTVETIDASLKVDWQAHTWCFWQAALIPWPCCKDGNQRASVSFSLPLTWAYQ